MGRVRGGRGFGGRVFSEDSRERGVSQERGAGGGGGGGARDVYRGVREAPLITVTKKKPFR